jgi:thiamine-phosphate pyrophosphorylase
MTRYYITDRRAAGGTDRLLQCVRRAAAECVELIQVREKDLGARDLVELTRKILDLTAGSVTRVLVNDRIDAALAAGAHGAHLPDESIAPQDLRCIAPAGFLIGVSAHSQIGIRAAQAEGADFVVFGPIFAPRSKVSYLPAQGVQGLREAVKAITVPVLALGGITRENAHKCIAAGAAGVAGISLFQD